MIYGMKSFFKIPKYTAHIITIMDLTFDIFNEICNSMIGRKNWLKAKLVLKNRIAFLRKWVSTLVTTCFKYFTESGALWYRSIIITWTYQLASAINFFEISNHLKRKTIDYGLKVKYATYLQHIVATSLKFVL